MSKTLIIVRRKSDGKVFRDVVNDACQVHNIYDDDGNPVVQDHDYNIGYTECGGFLDWSDFEEVKSSSQETLDDVLYPNGGLDRIRPRKAADREGGGL